MAWTTTKKPEELDFLLPDDDYDFVVDDVTPDEYPGKPGGMDPCDMFIVKLAIKHPDGTTNYVFDRFYADQKAIWRADQFAAAIGCPEGIPHDKMFNNSLRETGRCKIVSKEYNGKNYNNVQKYYAKG